MACKKKKLNAFLFNVFTFYWTIATSNYNSSQANCLEMFYILKSHPGDGSLGVNAEVEVEEICQLSRVKSVTPNKCVEWSEEANNSGLYCNVRGTRRWLYSPRQSRLPSSPPGKSCSRRSI